MHLTILTIYRPALSMDAAHLGRCVCACVCLVFYVLFWWAAACFPTCSTFSWYLAEFYTHWHYFFLSVDIQPSKRRIRIKKLAICCSIQGLFIMYLLPLFKSLMQEVRSHMTERKREGGRERKSIHVCCVQEWRSLYCYVQQRFPQQPHAPLGLLSKLRDDAPQLPFTFMHADTYSHMHTQKHTNSSPSDLWGDLNLWLRIALYKWYPCTPRDNMKGFWSLSCLTEEEPLKDERQCLIYWKTMFWENKKRPLCERTSTPHLKMRVNLTALGGVDISLSLFNHR